MTELRTRRLLVRRFTATDLADFSAFQADPRVRKHLPGEPMTTEQVTNYLSRQDALEEHQVAAWHGYAVQHIESGTVIGEVGVYLASGTEGDVGFQFHPDFHNQGFGTEAMTVFLEHLSGPFGLERITAGCDRDNRASQALLERLGLRPLARSEDGSSRYELKV
jgi:RimJ/RimL family protein N-acetyltransferase